MSSSTQHDLQTNEAPASVEVFTPSPVTTSYIEYTASMVSKCGVWIESRIISNHGNNVADTVFSFLRSSDIYHAFYQLKLSEYRLAQSQGIQADPDPPAHDCRFSFRDSPLKREPRTSRLFKVKEHALMNMTAQFVVRYGMPFWRDLMTRVMKDPLFAFMEPSDSRFSLFSWLIDAYARVIEPYDQRRLKKPCALLEGFFSLVRVEMQEQGVEMPGFVSGLDYFAGREDRQELQPARLYPFKHLPSFSLTYPQGVELGLFKLTAQFVARYGTCFERDLIKRVTDNDDPRFEFLKSPSDLHWIAVAYGSVLRPCLALLKPAACTETALEGFFSLVRGEKQEQGLDMFMTGLHAFVGAALPCFANREDDADLSLASLLSTLVQSDDAKHAHQPPLGSELAPSQSL